MWHLRRTLQCRNVLISLYFLRYNSCNRLQMQRKLQAFGLAITAPSGDCITFGNGVEFGDTARLGEKALNEKMAFVNNYL